MGPVDFDSGKLFGEFSLWVKERVTADVWREDFEPQFDEVERLIRDGLEVYGGANEEVDVDAMLVAELKRILRDLEPWLKQTEYEIATRMVCDILDICGLDSDDFLDLFEDDREDPRGVEWQDGHAGAMPVEDGDGCVVPSVLGGDEC